MKTKIKDIFPINDGIFNIFNAYFPTEFTAIFTTITKTELNIFANLSYGNKFCVDGLDDDTKTEVVCAVISINIKSWLETNDVINAEYEFNNVITRSKRGTISKEIDNTDTDTNFEKVFNDTSQTDTNRNVFVKDGLQVDTYNTTETETRQMQIDNIEKIIRLKKQNLYKDIINTICNKLTLDIY